MRLLRGTIVHAYTSFYKSRSAKQEENELSLTSLIWAQILAFLIFIVFTALFILGGVSAFAWQAVVQMFSAFSTEWQYFVEFVLYLVITAFTVYLIPTTWIAVFKLCKPKTWTRVLTAIVGAVVWFMCVGLIIVEVLLLIHAPSTDMPLVWTTAISFLAIFVLVDIGMFLLMNHTLKTSLVRQPTT